MAPNAQQIIALLERALTAAEPVHGLTTLNQLRGELDTLERFHVTRALQQGTSYTAIARPLGISRQAAHRRYRGLTAQPAAKPALSPEARSALIRAREEATRHGSISIDSTHLLLAIARQRSLTLDINTVRRSFGPPMITANAPTGLHPALHARLTRDHGPLRLDHLVRAALADPDGQRLLDRLGIPPQQLLDPVHCS